MTNYFALLGLERRPWLEEAALKEVFHARTLLHHPDTKANGANADCFAEINEAYRTLREPARRLRHLLRLEGADEANSGSIPPTVAALFPQISAITHDAQAVLARTNATTNALARGLLHAEVLQVGAAVEEMIARLAEIHRASDAATRQLDGEWEQRTAEHFRTAQHLQSTFLFISRWQVQLQETQFQLAKL